ncbi:hypothetical protein BBta_p0165 (plasmid) [Bradyrhizobium sp. BTAi1]|nr:hypothetical protein BBta_p0165 [Bradyrhizobium sp. BTAi1]
MGTCSANNPVLRRKAEQGISCGLTHFRAIEQEGHMRRRYMTSSHFGTVPCGLDAHTMGFEAHFYATFPRHGNRRHSRHGRRSGI